MQLIQGGCHRPFVRLHDAGVIAQKCRDGNGLGRREGEVIENPAIGALAFRAIRFAFRSCGLLSQREPPPGLRMEILAQADEFLGAGDTGQTQFLSPFAKPLTQDLLTFGVIVADAKMLLEISFRVAEAGLRFGGKHLLSLKPS